MKRGSDPDHLFETLATINETKLIAIVLVAGTEDYQAVLTVEQKSKGNDQALSDLEMVARNHDQQMNC
jgi:hypothetical protein